MEKIIETRNLTKKFGSFIAANQINLSVHKGEIYGFLGLNGAGKTTTIRMLLGLIKPTSGSVQLFGKRILPGGNGPWDQTGSLVEAPGFYPELTVSENLELVRRMRKIEDHSAVKNVCDKLGMQKYFHVKAGNLSLGNVQRLGLAKAFIHNPGLLILDEPTNGLDPGGIVEIRKFLIELSQQHSVTIFVSSHNLDEIARISTRIGVIHNGHLLKEFYTQEIHEMVNRRLIVNTVDNETAKKVLGQNGFSAILNPEQKLELSNDVAISCPEKIASLLVQAEVPPREIYVWEQNLEHLFLQMIRE